MNTQRQSFLNQPFSLPADVLIIPVNELDDSVRNQIECNDADYAVTRPGYRSTAKIIDANTVELLEQFRTPSRIADAIIRFAELNQQTPGKVLHSAFPALTRLSMSQLLVPANSILNDSVSASCEKGQRIGDHSIVTLIQALQDTELYQAKADDDALVALKIARPGADDRTKLLLARELDVLVRLNGACSPALVNDGSIDDQSYLAIEWIAGIPIVKRADELRYAVQSDWRIQLHDLASSLIAAYTQLHEQQVLHGDIHSGNILVDANERVVLIDFGLASVKKDNVFEPSVERSAMAWFMEPEAAKCLVNNRPLPDSTERGEQYSVAALVYHLITGDHHVKAPKVQDAYLQQVITTVPVPFSRQGFESWPDVEVVLARALSKKSEDRFPSMRAFYDAFCSAGGSHRQVQPSALSQLPDYTPWFEQLSQQVQTNDRAMEQWFPVAPRASVHAGAGGLAWALYRAAQVYDSADMLTAADVLCRRTLAEGKTFDAFTAPKVGITQDVLTTMAPLHTLTGLHTVHALVCHARGDFSGTGENILAFIENANKSHGAIELFLGRSGLLTSGAMILEAVRAAGKVDPGPLEEYLAATTQTLWQDVAALPEIGHCPSIPHLGMAHGWAGILFAQIRARLLQGNESASTIKERLDQIVQYSIANGRGLSWPGTCGEGAATETPDHVPGWCAGSAGFVQLWLIAHQYFGDQRYLHLADQAGWHTWEHPDTTNQLCCGLTGRSWALLALYQYTGDTDWLHRAEHLALSANTVYQSDAHRVPSTALFRGQLSNHLLLAEMRRPEQATMPFFGSEGWASQ